MRIRDEELRRGARNKEWTVEQDRAHEQRERLVAATVVRSNVNRAAREHAEPNRYDVVLDVFTERRDPSRIQLLDVVLGPMLPMIGSTVTVRVAGEISPDTVEILWRGDPNLDVDAHRQQLADIAESARRRRERTDTPRA